MHCLANVSIVDTCSLDSPHHELEALVDHPLVLPPGPDPSDARILVLGSTGDEGCLKVYIVVTMRQYLHVDGVDEGGDECLLDVLAAQRLHVLGAEGDAQVVHRHRPRVGRTCEDFAKIPRKVKKP